VDVFEAMWTLRAMRRLDPHRDVAEADLLRCIEAAGKAASGGGSERARYLVVRDPELKRKVGEIYRKGAETVLKGYEARAAQDPRAARMLKSAWHLADHMGEAPALIVACCKGPPGRFASSVFPGVQNLMLAARALGLGTTLTTIHLQHEDDLKRLLDIPDDVATYCVIPIGYPLGKWAEARRKPISDVTYWDRWGNPPPAGE
jgi:nitroreductase